MILVLFCFNREENARVYKNVIECFMLMFLLDFYINRLKNEFLIANFETKKISDHN